MDAGQDTRIKSSSHRTYQGVLLAGGVAPWREVAPRVTLHLIHPSCCIHDMKNNRE